MDYRSQPYQPNTMSHFARPLGAATPPHMRHLHQRRRSSIPELITEKVEDSLEVAFKPIRGYLGVLARFLIVATFFEDAARLVLQWESQVRYLGTGVMGEFYTAIFLIMNVITMVSCSCLAIARKYTELACIGLGTVVISQALAYGMFLRLTFILRAMSILGGLLMLEVEALSKRSNQSFFPTFLQKTNSRGVYFSLLGRVLLVFLVFGLVTGGNLSDATRVIAGLVSVVASVMVAVGFKARWSALFLIVFLSVANVILNGFWNLSHMPENIIDFRKFDFFQTLSVIGGYLALANLGPGQISLDEKLKKRN